MQVSYREAAKMNGFTGATMRGDIYNRIMMSYFRIPEIKERMLEAVSLGLVYITIVIVLSAIVPLGSLKVVFGVLGIVAGVYLIAFTIPMKGWFVYLADNMDRKFEL